METWKQYPLLKTGLAFGMGILLQSQAVELAWILAPLGVVLWAGACLSGKFALPIWDRMKDAGILTLFVGAGALLAHHEQQRSAPDWTSETRFEGWAAGVVSQEPRSTRHGWSAQMDIYAVYSDSAWSPVKARVLAYFPEKIEQAQRFEKLALRLETAEIKTSLTSYREYLASQGIFVQAYVRQAYSLGRETGWAAIWFSHQKAFSQRLQALIPDTAAAAMALAMFLGDKSQLSREVRGQFAAAGLSHILAISGMHVGVIYLLLNAALGFLVFLPGYRYWKNGMVLLVLLGYMFLTGAAPPVVRAVSMFSVVLVFEMFGFRYRTLNIMAIPGLLTLAWAPSTILQPGFQLSYAAVMGIVAGMPLFQQAFHCSNRWWNMLTDWAGVSFCATLATAPLVWIHFGQFPSHFMVSNLAATPVAALAAMGGFVLVLFAYVPGISTLLAQWVEGALQALGVVAAEAARAPHALVGAWSLSDPGFQRLVLETVLILLVLGLPKWVNAARKWKRAGLPQLLKVH